MRKKISRSELIRNLMIDVRTDIELCQMYDGQRNIDLKLSTMRHLYYLPMIAKDLGIINISKASWLRDIIDNQIS